MAQGNIPGDLVAAGTYDPISGTTLPGAHGLTMQITGSESPLPDRLQVTLAQQWASTASRLDVSVWLEQTGLGDIVIPLWFMFAPGEIFVTFWSITTNTQVPQPPRAVHVRVRRAQPGG